MAFLTRLLPTVDTDLDLFLRNLLLQGWPPSGFRGQQQKARGRAAPSLISKVAFQGHSFQLRQRPQGPREHAVSDRACTFTTMSGIWEVPAPCSIVLESSQTSTLVSLFSFTELDQVAPFPCFLGH